jgi:arylsulfatase A-like enzyme
MNEKKYNILWLFSDQHRAQTMRMNGDLIAKTPNLDKLAKDGVSFDSAFSVCPLCSPFRASLYTGKYMHQHGVGSLHVPYDTNLQIVPEYLKAEGYNTIHIGKWHISGGAAPSHFVSPYFRPGWSEWIGWENSNVPFHTEYSIGNLPKRYAMEGYQVDVATDIAIQKLDERSKSDDPWFMVWSVEPPHTPHVAPKEDMDLFKDAPIVFRKNVPVEFQTEELAEQLRGYYAQIYNVDKNVGRIIQKLKETGQYENTIIYYFADHGEFLGSLGRDEKMYAEDESSKIPFIIRHPDTLKRGLRIADVVSSLDITPTTFGSASLEIPSAFEGNDLTGFVLGKSCEVPKEVLIELNSKFLDGDTAYCYRALRSKEYLYVRSLDPAFNRLYSIADDPYFMKNLYDDVGFKDIRQVFEDTLKTKLEVIGDSFFATLDIEI